MGKLFGLGIQFAAALILFTYAGAWADRRFGTSPWGVLTGAFLGFGGGLYGLYRAATRSGPDDQTPSGRGGSP